MTLTLVPVDGGTRMSVRCASASPEAMDQVLAMGMLEGLQAVMSQIDGVLAEMSAA